MGQSLVKNYIHIVFSTKLRQTFISEDFENEVYAYLGGILKKLDCQPIKIGGYTDHVHILCLLSKKITIIKLLEEIISSSSKWVKTKRNDLVGFYWQEGYSAFSVNPSEIDLVIEYISNQKEHHAKLDFKEEYRAFLNKYKVDFDERYVWD
jgi:REP element-mobilizing transposase RayT